MRAKTKKRLSILAVAALAVVIGVAGLVVYRRAARASAAAEHLKLGLAAAAAGDQRQALDHLGTYLQWANLDNAQVLYRYGIARRAVERPGRRHLLDAIGIFRRVLELDPRNTDARDQLLDLYTQTARNAEAIDLATSVLDHDSDNPKALRAKTIALIRTRRLDEALPLADRYASVSRDDLMAPFLVLDTLQQLGRSPAEITARAKELREARPDDPRYLLLQSYAHRLAGEDEEARKWVRTAAAAPIQNPELLGMLVDQLDALSLFDVSLQAMRTYVEHGGDDLNFRLRFARRLWEGGDIPTLLLLTEDLKPDAPQTPATLVALRIGAMMRSGRLSDGRALIEKLTARGDDPVAGGWTLFLDQGLSAQDSPLQLKDLCERVLALDEDNVYARFALGEAIEALGESERAVAVWRRCAQERPSWAAPLARLASAAAEAGQYEQAVQFAVGAYLRSPNDAEVVITLASVRADYHEAGYGDDLQDLLDMVRQIQTALPGEPRTLPIQVRLLAETGAIEQAAQVLRQALEKKTPLPQPAIFDLAQVSKQYHLDLEQACYDKIESVYGHTPQLAFMRAIVLYEAGDTAGGLTLLRERRQRKTATAQEDQLDALLIARYLQITDHPDAAEAWVKLADTAADNVLIQREAIEASAVRDRADFLDRTIDRLRKLTGEDALGWRVARARWLLVYRGDAQAAAQAADLLDQVLKVSPGRLNVHLLMAAAQERRGDLVAAIEHLNRADELAPQTPQISLALAQLYLIRTDAQRARFQVDRVLNNAGTNPGQRRQAAAVLAELGQVDQAVGILESQRQDDVLSPDLLLADLYRRQGQYDRVLSMCRALLNQKEPDPEALAYVADVFASRGLMDEARAALKKLQQTDLDPTQQLLAQASFASGHGDAQQAVTLYRQALEQDPATVPAWYGLVGLAIDNGDRDALLGVLDQAAQAAGQDPAIATAHAQRPLIASLADPLSPLVRPLLVAIFEDPENSQAAIEGLGLFSQSIGAAANDAPGTPGASLVASDPMTAVRLRGLADRYPRSWSVQRLVIQANLMSQRYNEAAELAGRATQVFQQLAEPAFLWTQALSAQERWAPALSAAQLWRQRDTGDAEEADRFIAQAQVKLGRPRLAVTQLEPYLAVAATAPQAHASTVLGYAAALIADGQIAAAQSLLSRLSPQSDAVLQGWVALAAEIVTDPALAQSWLNQIQEAIGPDHAATNTILAVGWFQLSRRFNDAAMRKRARAMLTAQTQREDAPVSAWLALAFVREMEDQPQEAGLAYRHVLQLDQNNSVALNNLAMLLSQREATQAEAVTLARRAVNLDGDNLSFRHTLAHALRAAGRTDEAIAIIRSVLQRSEDNVEWQLLLGESLADQGKREELRRVLAAIDRMMLQGFRIDDTERKRIDELRNAASAAGAAATSSP